jgi:hypothetical protein
LPASRWREEGAHPSAARGQALSNLLLQFAGLLLRPGLVMVSLLPVVWLCVQIVQALGFGVAFVLSPLLLLGSTALAIAYLVLAKWIIVGRLAPGSYEVGTPFFYRWLMIHNLFNATSSFLGPYRGTALLRMFYRLCGAKLARGASIQTMFHSEPDLVSVGGETLVERRANLQPSIVANQFAVTSDVRFPNLEMLAASGRFKLAQFDEEVDPSLSWDVLHWIRECSRLPVFLKGILSSRDAALAIEHGASGVMVSNHGGRQLDTTPAAIEVLPEIRETVRSLKPGFPVYVDGGIRRGTDVFKAIALGADGVLIGRPCIYGLAADGYPGVVRVLNILKDEFVQTMRLAGCRSLAEIEPEMVRAADEVAAVHRGN